ncbi:MAG: hypothetical protein V3W34_05560 [Phycisphaerae bacterium]
MNTAKRLALCTALLSFPVVAANASPPIALDGICPVCLAKMNKSVPGSSQFSSVYDGRTYLFPGAEQKKTFDASPQRFVPVLGGDCVVCKVEKGKDVPGNAEFHVVHDGRLFLFPSIKQKGMFQQNPEKYADADLALGGSCAVCLVNKGKVVAGSADYLTYYDGRRYLFPSPMQKEMFDANPAAYAPALGGKCTVCKVEKNKNVPGDPAFHLVHHKRLFLFPSAKQLYMFQADPARYAGADLALDGKCTVCKVEKGKDVPGSPEFAVDYRGRRFLFPGTKQRGMFLANPGKYASVE